MDTVIFPDQDALRKEYDANIAARTFVVRELETRIEEVVAVLPSHPRVKGRVKTFESYFKKYIRLLKKETPFNGGLQEDILPLITDTIGLRVICPFLEDLAAVEELLKENFEVIEVERKGGDHTFREFGYESIHLLITIPADILNKRENCCGSKTAEIQIRTILQDAWAEVEHELIYKAEFSPFDSPLKRKLAAVNATLSLADIIFQEIRSYQRELNGELGKRRNSFFKKIEESTDAVLFTEEKPLAEDGAPSYDAPTLGELAVTAVTSAASAAAVTSNGGGEFVSGVSPANPAANVSIDDLLLNALYAHNKNQIPQAIAIYTQILEMKPDTTISSLIYKHRGMAYFARSHYEEAIADFSQSLELDPRSYKAAYYRGVICTVLRRYPEAIDSFNKALEINPYQPYCLYRRGQVYFHLEDYPQALGDCEAALALESFDAGRKFKELLLTKLKM